jgi:ribosomal protein S27E
VRCKHTNREDLLFSDSETEKWCKGCANVVYLEHGKWVDHGHHIRSIRRLKR